MLRDLDRPPAGRDPADLMTGMDVSRAQAVDLLHSAIARKAFDIAAEPAKLRERYGMHAWGQRCLLARRLVEHGASFVTMVLENPYQSGLPAAKDGTYNWDSHAVNCHLFNDLKNRLPIYDRCVSALVEDLYARGLDKKVMLIVTGEFGRTPRIEYSTGTQTGVKQPGRDHWPHAMSVLVAGGGMRIGQVVGSTNAQGRTPQGPAADALRPVGDDVPPSRHRLREHVQPRSHRPAALSAALRRTHLRIVVSLAAAGGAARSTRNAAKKNQPRITRIKTQGKKD